MDPSYKQFLFQKTSEQFYSKVVESKVVEKLRCPCRCPWQSNRVAVAVFGQRQGNGNASIVTVVFKTLVEPVITYSSPKN